MNDTEAMKTYPPKEQIPRFITSIFALPEGMTLSDYQECLLHYEMYDELEGLPIMTLHIQESKYRKMEKAKNHIPEPPVVYFEFTRGGKAIMVVLRIGYIFLFGYCMYLIDPFMNMIFEGKDPNAYGFGLAFVGFAVFVGWCLFFETISESILELIELALRKFKLFPKTPK